LSQKKNEWIKRRFKKSGEFDRLRRELLAQFQNGDGTEAFWERVDDIARTRLDAEDKLHLKAADTHHRELLQELDRFPLVERAVADVPALADPEFAAGIRGHAENLLKRSQSIPGGAFPPGVMLALVLTMATDCVAFFFSLFGLGVEEDVSRSQSNGDARDDAVGGRRNGADEGPRRDEGMEISDG